jgi:isocitrate dehydrogenase
MISTPITIAYGDGIGPSIMKATLSILEAAGAKLAYEPIEIGEKVYLKGIDSGIEASSWDSLRRTRIFLKAPITTPLGGGFKSLNVTIRKGLGLYANVRPCVSFFPFVKTLHPKMDLVVIRENEEDTYAGIEYQQTQEMTECLKLISRPGCERIVRYAFEYAVRNARKKITCMVKDNIMKLTDGLFAKVFRSIAAEYPQIEADTMIVDIGAARLADSPEQFDVVVTENLYGDILSDITAQIAGSVGLAGSANIGTTCSMFEAIHGSAPTLAGKNKANPSALIQAAVMMLVHIGQSDVAERIQNALLVTLEKGQHTADIYIEGKSQVCLSTDEFAQAVIANLGQIPMQLKAAHFSAGHALEIMLKKYPHKKKDLVGVDVYLDWDQSGRDASVLGQQIEALALPEFKLQLLSNRGARVYPNGLKETFSTDHWRARLLTASKKALSHTDILTLLTRVEAAGLDFIKTQNLYTFDGIEGYTE